MTKNSHSTNKHREDSSNLQPLAQYITHEIFSSLARLSFVKSLSRNNLHTKRNLQQNQFVPCKVIQKKPINFEIIFQPPVNPSD